MVGWQSLQALRNSVVGEGRWGGGAAAGLGRPALQTQRHAQQVNIVHLSRHAERRARCGEFWATVPMLLRMAGRRGQAVGVSAPSRLLEREGEAGDPGGSCMRNSGEVCRSQASEGAACSKAGGERGPRVATVRARMGVAGRGSRADLNIQPAWRAQHACPLTGRRRF